MEGRPRARLTADSRDRRAGGWARWCGLAFSIAFAIAAGPARAQQVLPLGETVRGEIGQDSPPVSAPALRTDRRHGRWRTRGQSYWLEIPVPDKYTVTLSSLYFDTYLVLRDAEGRVEEGYRPGRVRPRFACL